MSIAIVKEYDPRTSQWITTTPVLRDTSDADDWTPHPDWPDIKAILLNDTYGYAGSFIELITDDYDTISLSGGVAYRTSDGAYYTSASVTHTWNKDYDVPCARGYKTRWVITYLSSDTLSTYFVKQKNDLWLIFNCDVSVRAGTYVLPLLEAVEFINNKSYRNSGAISGYALYASARSLVKIPAFTNIVFNNISYLCDGAGNLLKIPGINIDSSTTTIYRAFYGCCCLQTILDILDVTNITDTGLAFNLCDNLRNVSIENLGVSLYLASSIFLTHASLLYLLQNLQTITAGSQTLTLGATNLAKLTDTEKALATDKGWLLA